VYVPCLHSDWVRMFAWDEAHGRLTLLTRPGDGGSTAVLPPGSGPRHLAFHSTLPTVAYTVNELASTLARFDYDPSTGLLSGDWGAQPQRIVSMLPPGATPGVPIRGSDGSRPVQVS
jgi:hypothetical protein